MDKKYQNRNYIFPSIIELTYSQIQDEKMHHD